MRKIYLFQLNKEIKLFLSVFLFSLSIGVIVGLAYLYHTTSFDKEITSNRFGADKTVEEDFGIVETTSKSVGEMLITTHNHIIGFSFIFFFTGAIFYFNSIINGFWKMVLIVEPFLSTIISFGSIWGIKFIGDTFIYITIISAVLMYASFFIMVVVSIFEMNLKQPA